jgi:hypothetical protein
VRVHKIDQQAHLTPPQCLLERPQGILDADGMPAAPIMRHLLDVFIDMLGSLFPWVEKDVLCSQIENRSGSVFLFNAIAAVAARFVFFFLTLTALLYSDLAMLISHFTQILDTSCNCLARFTTTHLRKYFHYSS